MIQKCYGKNCIVGFLCKQAEEVEDIEKRCSLIKNNIEERLNGIPSQLKCEDRNDAVAEVVFNTVIEVLDAIDHPNQLRMIDFLTHTMYNHCGYFGSLIV